VLGWVLAKLGVNITKVPQVTIAKDQLGPEYEAKNKSGIIDESAEQTLESLEGAEHIPYKQEILSIEETKSRAKEFYEFMKKRRSLRFFSDDLVPLSVIEDIIRTTGTSPSGANCQPWTFAVVGDMELKQKIKEVVEEEEKINYEKRMSRTWVKDLEVLGTTWQKPYLTIAPFIIIAFKQTYGLTEDGQKTTKYYFETSCGIACGFLIAAIHNAGLVTLTSTPMNAGPKIRKLLGRPKNEKVLLLLPVGYPAKGATVPNIGKKPLDTIMKVY